MKSIDVKSLIIGMLGTALVFVLMGSSFLSRSGKYDAFCLQQHSVCMVFNTENGAYKFALIDPRNILKIGHPKGQKADF